MSKLSERLNALSPLQREVLKQRLQGKDTVAVKLKTDAPANVAPLSPGETTRQARKVDFSLFFFSDRGITDAADKYRLLFESVKYADEHGFTAVWTPERHFQNFGGLYPNPSILSAALAMTTQRIQIRAGSITLPLHHPIRVAEEWSVVDNLSNGRVGVSFASGWHPDDFVLSSSPYQDRKDVMLRSIEVVQKLWNGEAVKLRGASGQDVEVRILPRPIQPKIPIWLTSSGSHATWIKAGQIGAHVLTGVKGDPAREFAEKVALYRETLAHHGHDQQAGRVTVMLHTFIGEDNDLVKERVRVPLTNYLRTFIAQSEHLDPQQLGLKTSKITEADKDALAGISFERFFKTNSLLGTPDKCKQIVDCLKEAGADEIACLIDFGLETDLVLESLRHLNELRIHYSRDGREP
jgi:natural product biosynthesis luciferase-like monooxygenase protein